MSEVPELGADLRVQGETLRCVGAWTARELDRVDRRLRQLVWPAKPEIVVDASEVRALDLAGAWVLRGAVQSLEQRGHRVDVRLRPEHAALLRMVTAPGLAVVAPVRLVADLRDVAASLARVTAELERDPRALVAGRAQPAPGPGE